MKSPWLVTMCAGLAITQATLGTCRGFAEPDPPAPDPELRLTIDTYPKVDGSTSTQPLLTIVACKVLGRHYQWIHSEVSDSRTAWANDFRDEWSDIEEILNKTKDIRRKPSLSKQINERIKYHGTHEAYVNLIDKDVDLILVARSPSEDELKLAGKSPVPLEARPVALDGFVFLLNVKNPVQSLTIEQIRDIYSGRVTNWRDVGGRDAVIRPYQRTRNSGSQELMRTLVMKERAMIRAPDLLTGAIMSFPYLALDDDVDGIGYSVYFYHEFMARLQSIKLCAVEKVLPSSESLRSRRYPFVTEVYVVVRGDLPAGHPARRLRDWLLGPVGQKTVEESGYVPFRDASTPASGNARPATRDLKSQK